MRDSEDAKVVPVIDLKAGQVVRAVAGRRDHYRPVESCFARDATPASVARGLVQLFGFQAAYVADLDAIAGAEPHWQSLQEIAATGLALLADLGLGDLARAESLVHRWGDDNTLCGAVVGLEAVPKGTRLAELVDVIGPDRAVFSIDLREGIPIARSPDWSAMQPCEIAAMAVRAGFHRLIVLDLASVGVGAGPCLAETCRSIRRAHRDIELLSGGGVRNVADVRALRAAGCDAVLVASALHDAGVRPGEVSSGLALRDSSRTLCRSEHGPRMAAGWQGS